VLSEMRETVSGYGRLRIDQSWGTSTHDNQDRQPGSDFHGADLRSVQLADQSRSVNRDDRHAE